MQQNAGISETLCWVQETKHKLVLIVWTAFVGISRAGETEF